MNVEYYGECDSIGWGNIPSIGGILKWNENRNYKETNLTVFFENVNVVHP